MIKSTRPLYFLLSFVAIVSSIFLSYPSDSYAQTVDGSYSFTPNGEYKVGCADSVNVILNTGSNDSNAANVIINYNPTQITITDSNSQISGTQIQQGSIYEAYAENTVDPSTGEIRLTGFSIMSNFSGSGIFGTIHFIPNPGVTSIQFSVQFTGIGDTLDSNIAETNSSDDILQSVSPASYSVIVAPCTEDTAGPSITPIKPTQYEFLNCDENECSTISFNVCDSDSGVDINSVNAEIYDIMYLPSDVDHFAYESNGDCYNVTVTLSEDLPRDTAITAHYYATDFKGNSSRRSVIFNLPSGTEYITEPFETIITEWQECTENLEVCETIISNQIIRLPGQIQTISNEILRTVFSAENGLTELSPSLQITLSLLPILLLFGGILLMGRYLGKWLWLYFTQLTTPKDGTNSGAVYNSVTNQPLANVIIRIYSNGEIITTCVTNSYGEFRFSAPASAYVITASKTGYLFPSSLVPEKSNSTYKDIYHGEPLNVTQLPTNTEKNTPEQSKLSKIIILMDPKNKLTGQKLVRRIAQVWSGLNIAFLLLMVVGEVVGSIGTDAVFPTLTKGIAMVFFPIGIAVGQAISWKYEKIGGLVTLVSFVAFSLIILVPRDRVWPEILIFAIFTFPAILFPISDFLSKKKK